MEQRRHGHGEQRKANQQNIEEKSSRLWTQKKEKKPTE
jgi:hypothetical protein